MRTAWATVKSTSPLEVLIDGAEEQGPAVAPVGLTLAVDARVRVELAGRTLLIVNRYS